MAKWLGVDVGDVSVRVALLQSTLRKTSVLGLREEPIAEHGSVGAALRAASTGLKADAYGTSLSGERAFLRRIELPKAAQKELDKVLSFEVEATLPVELDDAVMDHRMLSTGANSTMLNLFAGVAYTHDVRDCINLVRRGTSHEPSRVGVGPLPLINLAQSIPQLSSPTPIAIIDFDHRHTDVLIIEAGEPRFSRFVDVGVDALPGGADKLAAALRRTLGAWRASGQAPVQAAYVVGAGSMTPGIDSFLQNEVGVGALPLPAPKLEGLTETQLPNISRFAKAIGIALGQSRRARDLNLRQGPLEAQQGFHFLREKTPLLAGLLAAILVSFGFSIFAESHALEKEKASLEARLASASKLHLGKSISDPKEVAELMQQRISGSTDDPMPEMDAFDTMVALSELISSEITHDIKDYYYDRGKVTLTGLVPTIDNAQAVRDAISEHRCFKDVTMQGTKRLRSQQKQKYELSFNVKCSAAKTKKKKSRKTKGAGK